MKQFAKRKITFTVVKVNDYCDLMIKVMTKCYIDEGLVLNVTDLANACKHKSQAEVTQDFIKATSYILSVAVGNSGPATGGKKSAK